MKDRNLFPLTGFVTKDATADPIYQKDQNGNPTNTIIGYSGNFHIAINGGYTDQNGKSHETATFVPYHRFLKKASQANFYINSLTKGKHLAILTSIKNNNYVSQKYGKQFNIQFYPHQIIFLSPKKQSSASQNQGQQQPAQGQQQNQPAGN